MNTNLILLLEQLELYGSAGLSINKALDIVIEGNSKKMALRLRRVRTDIVGGMRLAQSLLIHLNIPKTIAGLIEHGELHGDLLKSLTTSKMMLEKQSELFKKCASALVYPSVIAVFSILLTLGLVRGIMPQIIPMLASLHVKLPLLTRIVIEVTNFTSTYGLVTIIIGCAVIVLMFVLYTKTEKSRHIVQVALLQLPLIGNALHTYAVSTFLQSLGSLIHSGVPIDIAFERTIETVAVLPLRYAGKKLITELKKGIGCSVLIPRISSRIPLFVTSLIIAGETSGHLGDSMMRASQILDQRLDYSLKRLTSLIEPIMMVGMGCIVGSIALSIMMPIYDISLTLQH